VSTTGQKIVRWQSGARRPATDHLATEEPLEIRIDTRPLLVTMRTPGHDVELAAGLLFTEGLITSRNDVCDIKANRRNTSGNSIDVFLVARANVDLKRVTRRMFVSSSCGVCGKDSIRAVQQKFKAVRSRAGIDAKLLLQLPDRLRHAQPAFERTGGLHAAGIFTLAGELVAAREDIGRHNAVDKVIGFGLLNELLPFDAHVLVVSGRASFEIMQKSIAARIPIVCAVSAPSSLAVEFAKSSKQTLAGFVRDGRMNIYAGARRIL
jgi:FdhD protein